MKKVGDNIRNLLPTLALGVFITLLAALFNYLTYGHRLPAMAMGNRPLNRERAEDGEASSNANLSPMRMFAGLVNMLDDMATDAMYRIRGPGDFPSTKDRIAVIAIDEASVLRRSWPWSRSDIASLMDKLQKARVVGMDLLYSDPDRTSLANYLDRFDVLHGEKLDLSLINPEYLDNDLRLARKISNTNTVLGAMLYNGSSPGVEKPKGLIENYTLKIVSGDRAPVEPDTILLKRAANIITDIPVIRQYEPIPNGEGFMNLFPAANGVVRSVPMFVHVPDRAFSSASKNRFRICPSLALEVMRVNLDGDGYRLKVRGDVVTIPDLGGLPAGEKLHPVHSVVIIQSHPEGDRDLLEIPLNEFGEMELSFRSHRHDFTVYSAWEVLKGMHDGKFDDKLVIIGGTVEGVGSVLVSRIAEPEFSSAEAHAAMLSVMLKGDFMDSGYRDDYAWQQVAILATGLLVTLAVIFGDLGLGMLVSSLCLLGLFTINYSVFFTHGKDVGITLPALSILAVFVVLVVTNYLVVGRERRFIRKAFSLNVSPSILGYLESHPDQLSSLQGENRRMTVLFTDIRGFTSISERMTAAEVARFLNEYFTPMSDIVMQNAGTVDKFIGDGLMAFWNAPAENVHHARDASQSALDMVAKLSELQIGWTSRGLPKIAVGCGINTGPMFAGYMGSEQRKNYTVMGDNVNIASRLENLNKVYSSSILITESTRQELGPDFVCRVVDKVRVSGKQAALIIYELLGRGPASEEECEELAAFARVFELYQMREFATAETLLKELVFIRPTPLYKMYLDRLAIYKALPPPQDWDGTFSMAQK